MAGGDFPYIFVIYGNRSLIYIPETHEQFQQCGFSGTAGSVDTGNLTRSKFQGVVIQDGFVFVCEGYVRCFGSGKSGCTRSAFTRNLLHQRLLLQKGQHTLAACQCLVQVVGKTGQRHNRAKRSHHSNGTGKDPVKTNLTFSI